MRVVFDKAKWMLDGDGAWLMIQADRLSISHIYDSAQMSRLISLVVEDCKEQGIETMTPQELSLLLEGWK